MIANIIHHFLPFEKINPVFHMLLLLSLSIMAPVYAVVHWIMDNDNYAVPVKFKDANESRNSRDDDDNIDPTEVMFYESHFKDAEHAHE